MWRKALTLGDRRQQLVQGVALMRIQPGGEQPVVLTPQLADLADHLLAGRGQMERMTTRLGNKPSWPLSACWLRPGSAAIARRIPACGGVRSIDAIRSANTEADRWPSWDSKNATLSPLVDAADTDKSYHS